jgi:hypothetical protein
MKLDFYSIYEQVLNDILPEKNKELSNKTELRYGGKGSIAFNTKNLTFFDHEIQVGGGFLDLIQIQVNENPWEWLRKNGYADDTRKTQNNSSSLSLAPAPVATKRDDCYVYTTESGEPLYRIFRTYDQQGKRHFKQERFDSNSGQWVNGLKNADGTPAITKTLYNLPELIERPNDAVFIVEGEKCVNSLKSLGLLATTSGSAQSWRDEFAQFLKGRDVIVMPDFDDVGAKYADAVVSSLLPVAKSVKCVELSRYWQHCPPKGDVSDFIEAGGQPVDLLRMIEQTDFATKVLPLIQVKPNVSFARVGDAIKAALKPIPWLVEGFFIRDSLCALVGKPSSGKSLISLSLAASIATGSPWFGNKTQKGTVVYLAGEGQWGISRRLMAWSKHNDISLDNADLFLSNHAVMIGVATLYRTRVS